MLNKENYVSWSSRLLLYVKSRPNEKLIHNSILNGPYVRKMIPEPGDANREITVTETFHLQTHDELSDKKLKQIEADDQAIQTILLGLPADIYAATKNLHTADYTQLYDFLKYNQKEVDELKAERLAKNQDPLALMANSNNPYVFPAPHQDQSSFNQNYLQLPTTTNEYDTRINGKSIQAKLLNTNQQQSDNFIKPKEQADCSTRDEYGYNDVIGNQVIQNAVQNPRVQNVRNQNGVIGVQGNVNQNQIENGNLVAARAEGNVAGQNRNQIRCYNCMGKEEAADLDEIEEVNANCILMAICSKHQPRYTELLEPILESYQVPQNNNDVISKDTSVEQGGETVKQHSANFEETHALYESLYQNLAIKLEKVNSVNRKLKETNADMTTELARFKNQERCFEISQEKYDKLE
nr:hypothetical protein [Tanacetum cinerariifolium]